MTDKIFKIYVRDDEYGEVTSVVKKTFTEFMEWKDYWITEKNAEVIPNGNNSIILVTANRYFVVEVI